MPLMSETPITAEYFLAHAAGLSEQQRSAVAALSLLGAKPWSRWAAIAQDAAPADEDEVTTLNTAVAATLGLNDLGVFVVTNRFGADARPLREWRALAAQYLANPGVWLSKCAQAAPIVVDTPGDDCCIDDIPGTGYLRREGGELRFVPLEIPEIPDAIPEGEGFLERHNGDVQLTPLLIEEVTPDEGGAISTTFAPTTWGNNGPS